MGCRADMRLQLRTVRVLRVDAPFVRRCARTLGLWTSSAALRAADPPSVAIVKQIPVMGAKVVEVVKGLDATKLLAVDGKCELAKLTECKAMIAAGGPRDAGVPRSASQLDVL